MFSCILAFTVFFASCTRGGGAVLVPVPAISPGNLRVQLPTEPVTLDPSLAEDGFAIRVLYNVMEGLVGYDGEGHLQNRLAESYKTSEHGTRYEFKLRKAFWSDGVPVQAEDFVTGIRRTLDPKTASKLAALLGGIKAISAHGDRVVIDLEHPTPYIVQALSLPGAFPQRKDILEANGGNWPVISPCTGTYRITKYDRASKMLLEKNVHYTPAQGPLPKIGTVELLIVPDETTGENLYSNGQLDILAKIPLFSMEKLKSAGKLISFPFTATYYLSFNTRTPPFNDREWRRAFAGSIDKQQLLSAISAYDEPASSWVPPGLEGFARFADQKQVFADSVARVRSRANWNGTITGAFDSGTRNQMIFEKLQQDLKKSLALDFTLNNLDWKSYVRTLQTNTPQVFRFGWLAPFMDPVSHLQVFTSGNANNYSGWSDLGYDELVKEIETMSPGPVRLAKIRQAQEIITEREAVVIPLYHYMQSYAISSRLKGFRANPQGVVLFSELEFQ